MDPVLGLSGAIRVLNAHRSTTKDPGPQVKVPARDHRMRPVFLASTFGWGKSALLDETGGSGLHQGNHTVLGFFAAVEETVGIGDGALIEFAFLLPYCLAGLKILACPSLAIGVTVKV